VKHRANLFKKNVASNVEAQSLATASSLHQALVSLSSDTLIFKTNNGVKQSIKLSYKEKDFSTSTYIGRFENGSDFRLVQPTGLALDMAKKKYNAINAFTIASINPNGWALNFFLTEKDDLRQTSIEEKGSQEQIQRLIQGAMMSIQLGMQDKFIEITKRLLPMIESNPIQLNRFEDCEDYIYILKNNVEVFDSKEREIINKI
jgi:hypothetical protein